MLKRLGRLEMNKLIFTVSIIGTFTVCGYSHAQKIISFHSGINKSSYYMVPRSIGYLDLYYHTGINFGFSFETKIMSHLSVAPGFEYSYYKFDSFIDSHLYLIPEIKLKSATGTDSHIIKALVEARIIDSPDERLRFFVVTGVGFVAEYFGDIEATWKDLNGPDRTSVESLDDKAFFAHTFGFGLRYFIKETMGLQLECKYFSNYYDRSYFSLNIGLLRKL